MPQSLDCTNPVSMPSEYHLESALCNIVYLRCLATTLSINMTTRISVSTSIRDRIQNTSQLTAPKLARFPHRIRVDSSTFTHKHSQDH